MADPTRIRGQDFRELQTLWEEKFDPQQVKQQGAITDVFQNTVSEPENPYSPQVTQRGRSITASPKLEYSKGKGTLKNFSPSGGGSPLMQKVASTVEFGSEKSSPVPERPPRPFLYPSAATVSTSTLPNLEKQMHEDEQACQDLVQDIASLQMKMKALTSQNDTSTSFLLATSFKRQHEDLKAFTRQTFYEFHRVAYISDQKNYVEHVDTEEKVIKELRDKLCDFLTRMEVLIEALETKNVELKPLNNKKEVVLLALKKLQQKVPILKIQACLKALLVDIHKNPEATLKTFQEIDAYFRAVDELTCMYIKEIGYTSIQVIKNKAPYRVKVKDRFGVETELEATTLLTSIPRELAQYGSLIKDLTSAAKQLLKTKETLEFPCLPEVQLLEGCALVDTTLKELQETMNARNSLFE